MMAYASWSVVFGEQPSAAKWNILGTNDASFNDGTGIGTNAIAAASLATSAIKLGYTATTSNFVTSSATPVQITGLTSTVTIPAGSRSIEISAMVGNISVDAGLTTPMISIWDGVVGSGTQIGQARGATLPTATYLCGIFCSVVVTPAAGSKTYNVGLSSSAANQITGNAAAIAPNTLIIKAI